MEQSLKYLKFKLNKPNDLVLLFNLIFLPLFFFLYVGIKILGLALYYVSFNIRLTII
jgi:hypothetical protein